MCKAYFLLSGQKIKHIPWNRAVAACSVEKLFFLRAVVNGWTYIIKLTRYFKKYIKHKSKIKLLVSLSVLQYLGKQLLQFYCSEELTKQKRFRFCSKGITCKQTRWMKKSNGLPHSPRATTQAELWKWFNTVS